MKHLAINGGDPVRTRPMPVYPQLGEREVEAATRVVRSNNLSSQFGDETENLEGAFSEYSGAKHVVATSCGTTALQVALAALGIGTGDEVIVPAYTFLATATSVLMQNGVPVFADSEPLVQGMDTDHVEKLLTDRTRAIMPVHANGFPMDMDPLMALARSKGLSVIEDCSHAHGGEHKGRMVGTIGHINAFSLQQKKNLSAGEGGLITTDDDELAQRCRAIRSFGKVDLGYNYRMSEIHAAICAVRLRDLDEANDLRIRNADYLHEHLAGLPGIRTQRPLPETRCVYYNFIAQIDSSVLGVPKSRFIEAVNAEGVTISKGYTPVYRSRSFRGGNDTGRGCSYLPPFYEPPEDERPNYEDGACPVCENLCDNQNLEIKVHPPATTEDMADYVAAIRKVVENIDEIT